VILKEIGLPGLETALVLLFCFTLIVPVEANSMAVGHFGES